MAQEKFTKDYLIMKADLPCASAIRILHTKFYLNTSRNSVYSARRHTQVKSLGKAMSEKGSSQCLLTTATRPNFGQGLDVDTTAPVHHLLCNDFRLRRMVVGVDALSDGKLQDGKSSRCGWTSQLFIMPQA
ncbi:RAB GDP dissociation inhibitor alpha [Perkinsela sp. CCAP 1560/4]|nr:RAB GDP dissociation inhibitor alpha [Perkinsela sp. CCAP 1560/4]|eukprot:KNH05726.1 RAB GDP dissociation inhibitor alpha [Perkinsela sp. CCAP 1560/4]